MAIQNDDIRPDYTIHLSASVLAESGSSGTGVAIDAKFAPFRMYVFGPHNLRGQTTANYYKTFLGKQQN